MTEESAIVPTFFTVDAVEGGEPLGMESGSIPDESIIASSCADGVTPSMGRLNAGNSWCTRDVNDCFLQVDFGKLHLVCAVATHGNRTPDSNGDYVTKYHVKHSNDGVNWIVYEEPMEQAVEVSEGPQGEIVFQSGAADDAKRLYEAMKGWGTDESVLGEILCTRDNAELAAIREIYEDRYKTSLEEALSGELSGSLRSLLVELAKGERDESKEIDTDLVESDARDLMAAGVQAWGTDEDVFIRVFTQRNLLQLSATFSAYRQMGNEEISQSIESEMSGDLKVAFLTLVNRVQADPVKFYADQIRKTLEEGDWGTVCRIVFSRSKAHLDEIRTAYLLTYGSELADDVNMMYNGDNKMALVERIDRTKVLKQRIFDGNTDPHSVERNELNQPIITRFVRFCPLEWHVWPCMSVELYGTPVTEQAAEPPRDDDVVVAENVAEVESTPEPVDGEESTPPHDVSAEDEGKQKEAQDRLNFILDEEKKALEEDILVVDRRKQIEDDHRKRMEEIERRIQEQEDKRKQEMEEKRRAEEEERMVKEEERRKREEEAAKKREDERKQLEEERQNWENERKKREEEVRQMIEEGRRKREEERRKREDEHRQKRDEERKRREEERKVRLEEERQKLVEGRQKRDEEFRRRMDENKNIKIDVAIGLETSPKQEVDPKALQDERKRKEELWNKRIKDPLLVEEEMKQVRDEERKRLAEERRKNEEEEAERNERDREIRGEWRAKIDDTRPELYDEKRIIEYRLKAMEEERKKKDEEYWKTQRELEKKKKLEENERLKALDQLVKKTDEQRDNFRKQREEEERKRWEEREARKNEEEKRRKWIIEERAKRVEDERKKREEEAALWQREMEKKEALEEEDNNKKEEEERKKHELIEKRRLEEIEQKGLEAEKRRKREEEQRRKDDEEHRKKEERERWRKKQYEKRMSGELVRRKSEEDLREREKREETWEKEMVKRHSKNFENKLVFITGSPQKAPDAEEVVVSHDVSVVEAIPMDDDDPDTTVTTKRTVTVRTVTTTVRQDGDYKPDVHFRPIPDSNGETQPIKDGHDVTDSLGHDHKHDHSKDWYRRSCCDHLMPLDSAVQDAIESSFFSKYDEDKFTLRPFLSWHGGLDLGSALQLYTPSKPIDDAEIDKLLDIEQEGPVGWKKIKKTRDLEISRKEVHGPAITKAVITLTGIPYRDAVSLITDWSIRNKWDNTFDSVDIVDEMANFKVINCSQKKKRSLVLATLEREEASEPCHVVAWQKTVEPGITADSKTSALKLDTMTCGTVIRPYYEHKFSKVTIITQLRGNVPGPLRNTYLSGNPSKWLSQLKKYHTKHYVEVKTAKPKGAGGEIPTVDDNVIASS